MSCASCNRAHVFLLTTTLFDIALWLVIRKKSVCGELRDLKSNLLDNATFRKELEAILKDPALSQELRDEMSALAPK